jgi:hypothetical protein
VTQRGSEHWRILSWRLAVVKVGIRRAHFALMPSCMAAKKRHECVCGYGWMVAYFDHSDRFRSLVTS